MSAAAPRVWKAGKSELRTIDNRTISCRPLRSRTKMQLLIFPGYPGNDETGSRHAFEAKLGEHVSKIRGDVVTFSA